jgi:hypothetical protein
MAQDVFFSPAVKSIRSALLKEALAHEEFETLSLDATLRCTFPLMGQAAATRYRWRPA